uniref:Exonuclease domain-containing protein n=1 Tax=Macrostomum lignano TaxID=282301 RepID=A0A1I8IZA1_9PLAT
RWRRGALPVPRGPLLAGAAGHGAGAAGADLPAAPPAAAAGATAGGGGRHWQHLRWAPPWWRSGRRCSPPRLRPVRRHARRAAGGAAAAAAAASCQQLCLMPGFDLVKWYSEKPPFVLDGRVGLLYKMRGDRPPPAQHGAVADAEFNTILAEYLVLRQVFGPDYPVHENVFIKLNRSKEGELAKFIHIYFRDRSDASCTWTGAQRVGALAPCWCNRETYSKHNVYITSLPYFLLAKDALCQYIRTFVLPGCGARDPIRRARVDPDKRSAQREDAESLIEHFHRHMDANARPAFESKEQRRGGGGLSPCSAFARGKQSAAAKPAGAASSKADETSRRNGALGVLPTPQAVSNLTSQAIWATCPDFKKSPLPDPRLCMMSRSDPKSGITQPAASRPSFGGVSAATFQTMSRRTARPPGSGAGSGGCWRPVSWATPPTGAAAGSSASFAGFSSSKQQEMPVRQQLQAAAELEIPHHPVADFAEGPRSASSEALGDQAWKIGLAPLHPTTVGVQFAERAQHSPLPACCRQRCATGTQQQHKQQQAGRIISSDFPAAAAAERQSRRRRSPEQRRLQRHAASAPKTRQPPCSAAVAGPQPLLGRFGAGVPAGPSGGLGGPLRTSCTRTPAPSPPHPARVSAPVPVFFAQPAWPRWPSWWPRLSALRAAPTATRRGWAAGHRRLS